MEFRPITQEETFKDNSKYQMEQADILDAFCALYERVGYNYPWIGYFVYENDILIGCCGFKYPPVNHKVEIAYSTIKIFEGMGIGTKICTWLVDISLQADPNVIITARTLPEKNASTSILKKNNFTLLGEVNDEEDGLVWEWVYQKNK